MQIPLFPLHTVLAPGIALPLHIFEPRYRALVRRCVDTESPFGVVLIREGSETAPRDGSAQELAIASIGTLAEIREASRYTDGRWDVLAVGGSRFAIREVLEDAEPYLVAEVEPVPDVTGNAAVAEALVGRVTARFVQYLRLLQPRDGESAEPIDVQVEVEVPDAEAEPEDEADAGAELGATAPGGGPSELASALRIPDDPSALSFLLTGILQVEPERKQALLEADSAAERLAELDELLDREMLLLARRLAPFTPDRASIASRAN